MRRPVLPLFFAQALGILTACYTGIKLWQLCLLAVVTALWHPRATGAPGTRGQRASRRGKKGAAAAAAVFVIGFAGLELCDALLSSRADGLLQDTDGPYPVRGGVVVKAEVKSGRGALTVRLSGGLGRVLVRFDTEDEDGVYDLAGRELSFQAPARVPDGVRNPGGFDYASYLKARWIGTVYDVSPFRVFPGAVKRPLLHALSLSKGRFLSVLKDHLGEDQFAIASGLIFGEKAYMDEDIYESFRKNGTAHVLAVSGLHVGLLYGLVLKLTGERRNLRTSAITVLSVFLYAALCNFAVSVVRAGLMISLRVLSTHLGRRYDHVSAACVCAMGLAAVNPYRIFDPGFQLSFLAAFILGVCVPWASGKAELLADRYRKEWIRKAGDRVLPPVFVQLGMAPLVAFQFMTAAPIGLILNPVIIALAGLLLPAGLLVYALTLFVPAGASGFFGASCLPAGLLASAMKLLNDLGNRLPGSGVDVAAPPVSALVVIYLCFFFFFSETRYILVRRGLPNAARAAGLGLVLAGSLVPYALGVSFSPLPWRYNEYPVVFLDVGQGDSIHIRTGGLNILVDGGGIYDADIAAKTLKPYLLKNGVTKLDLAVVTHSDLDHSLGIRQLSEKLEVAAIAFPSCYEGTDRTEGYTAGSFVFLDSGDLIEIGDRASMAVLYPPPRPGPSEDSNDDSLVILLDIDGFSLLLTGDLGKEGEAEILRGGADPAADVLKLGHHGSAGSTGETFLERVSPAFAVISCGRNNRYGHPAPAVIELLEDSDIMYARTDLCGAVCLRSMTEGGALFENAARDRRWQLSTGTDKAGNTPSGP